MGVSAANQPAESQLRDRREFRPARGRTDRVECCDARAGRSKRHPVDTVRVLPRAHHPPRGTPPTQPRDGNPRPFSNRPPREIPARSIIDEKKSRWRDSNLQPTVCKTVVANSIIRDASGRSERLSSRGGIRWKCESKMEKVFGLMDKDLITVIDAWPSQNKSRGIANQSAANGQTEPCGPQAI